MSSKAALYIFDKLFCIRCEWVIDFRTSKMLHTHTHIYDAWFWCWQSAVCQIWDSSVSSVRNVFHIQFTV